MEDGPLLIERNCDPPPHRLPVMSSKTLLTMVMRFVNWLPVLDDGPGRRVVLVPRREQQRVPGLTRFPVVLDDVAFDRDALRVLQLDRILHVPQCAAGGGRARCLSRTRVREGGAPAVRVAVDSFPASRRAPINAIAGRAAHRAPA